MVNTSRDEDGRLAHQRDNDTDRCPKCSAEDWQFSFTKFVGELLPIEIARCGGCGYSRRA